MPFLKGSGVKKTFKDLRNGGFARIVGTDDPNDKKTPETFANRVFYKYRDNRVLCLTTGGIWTDNMLLWSWYIAEIPAGTTVNLTVR